MAAIRVFRNDDGLWAVPGLSRAAADAFAAIMHRLEDESRAPGSAP